MKNEQRFIAILRNTEGRTVDFERWNYKRLSTVKKKMFWLYDPTRNGLASSIYGENLEKTSKVVIHETDYEINDENIVWECSKEEFINMMTK